MKKYRQVFKYLLCLLWWGLLAFSIYMILSNLFWFILVSLVIIGISIGSISSDSEYKWFIFRPNLGKRVVHLSGEYFLEFCPTKKHYKLYVDRIFYKKMIWSNESWRFNNSHNLSCSIKEFLDKKYYSETSKIEEINRYYEIMNNWDGYTSVQEKRNDKISKVIN